MLEIQSRLKASEMLKLYIVLAMTDANAIEVGFKKRTSKHASCVRVRARARATKKGLQSTHVRSRHQESQTLIRPLSSQKERKLVLEPGCEFVDRYVDRYNWPSKARS